MALLSEPMIQPENHRDPGPIHSAGSLSGQLIQKIGGVENMAKEMNYARKRRRYTFTLSEEVYEFLHGPVANAS